MSADNSIIILTTPDGNGQFQYRVLHCQAIENIYWDKNSPNNNNPDGNPKQVVAYFGKCDVFAQMDNALKLAQEMKKEILADEFCPILEYGISFLELPHQFKYYVALNNISTNKMKEG